MSGLQNKYLPPLFYQIKAGKLGAEKHSIHIAAYKNNVFIGKFDSITECARYLGISVKTIYNRLNNNFSSRTGYEFEKEGDACA